VCGCCLCCCVQGLRNSEAVGRVLAWDEFLQWGSANPRDAIPPSAEDISTIMFSAGTTGESRCIS
jgi:acyl-coenzyme A synthetase/AMP-(fatty) acid ligase